MPTSGWQQSLHKLVFDLATAPTLTAGQTYSFAFGRGGQAYGLIAAYPNPYPDGSLVNGWNGVAEPTLDLIGGVGYTVAPQQVCGGCGTYDCCCPAGYAPNRCDFFVGGHYDQCPPDQSHAPGCLCLGATQSDRLEGTCRRR